MYRFGLAIFAISVTMMNRPALGADGDDLFEKRIRPLFIEKCVECHGDSDPEGGLRLTSRAALVRGGKTGPGAVEKKPDSSLILQAVRRVGKLKMPPDDPLSDAEIHSLQQWIEMGMPWPESQDAAARAFVISDEDRQHWSFRPVSNPPLSAVTRSDWSQSPIDTFLLAKIESAGLQPSSVADRRTLIRRAYFDLIGLPPTWEETEQFVQDPTPTDVAFARLVDRLLSSPAYGERWGRHWLDVARFADTKDGVLMYGDDRIRPYAYTYRDYVIRSFNEDLPFDRFIHEQLAADLIKPEVAPSQLAAMGFLTLGRMYDNNVHDVIDDQIDTVGRGLLGLTLACARCHDHKSDPVPTADYYSLYGVFASSEAPLELPLIGTISDSADVLEFEKKYSAKRDELRKMLDEQFILLTETARQRVSDYLVRVATTEPDPMETAIFFLSLAPEDLRPPIVARWRRLVAARAEPTDPVFGMWHDLLNLKEAAGPEFTAAAAKVLEQWKAAPSGTEKGQVNPLVRDALLAAVLKEPADVARCYGELLSKTYSESRNPTASGSASPPIADPVKEQLLTLLVGRESPGYFPKSQTRRYMSRQETDKFGGLQIELDRIAVQFAKTPPRAMSLVDSESPHDPRVFVRGNPSRPGQPVPRQFLEILSNNSRDPFGGGSGRLALARAITDPKNPLTARVFVNRVWMHHFGESLVASPSDFGRRSAPPSHPELLDHLASQFIADGWSIKNLHRRIMTSRVYQGSSEQSPVAAAASASGGPANDPENRLFARMNRRRLEFESLRDSMLAVSSRLQLQSGGRPVNIATDPMNQRRTVYGLVDRQSLPDVYRSFDFATPDQSVERRPRTVVPQQALFALNSEFVLVQAKSLAASVHGASSDDTDRIHALFRTVFQRNPSDEDVRACLEFIANAPEPESKLNPWEQLCQVFLLSNEFMYID